ncbi:MAG: DUF5667 domain-containing protein [Caulobacteraceae bacterium]
MYKKIIVLIMAVMLAVLIPVFADEQAGAADPGITPDSPFYILDRLLEKIQLSLISDALKESEALAKQAQERLAESKAMLEANNIELAKKAISEYTELMGKSISAIDKANKDEKSITKAVDMIANYKIEDEDILDKVIEKVPDQYKEELKKAVENLPEKDSAKPENVGNADRINSTSIILQQNITDKAFWEKIQQAGLNNRLVIALISLSKQSGKSLNEVVDLFLKDAKGIGKTAIDLKIAPKDALKEINKAFKEAKTEAINTLKNAAGSDAAIQVVAAKSDDDKDAQDSQKLTNSKDNAKSEKKLDKAVEKTNKQIEKIEKKYEKKLEKATEKVKHKADSKSDDKDDDENNNEAED